MHFKDATCSRLEKLRVYILKKKKRGANKTVQKSVFYCPIWYLVLWILLGQELDDVSGK